MALSKITRVDGTGSYTFEEYPSIPGGRSDLSLPLDFEAYRIEHKRNNVIIERTNIETKYWWNLFFRNISQAMIESLQVLAMEGKLYFYPDSSSPTYYVVYWISKFRAKYVRGGKYNLSVTLLQR